MIVDTEGRGNSLQSGPQREEFIVDRAEVVLVTGAGGYVGAKVVKVLLSYGFTQIRCLLRSTSRSTYLDTLAHEYPDASVQRVQGNLLSVADCAGAADGVSLIYHLAAGVEKSYAGCFLNSVVATRNLLDAAARTGRLRRFVNVGSIATYGNYGIRRGGSLDETCEVDAKIMERYEPYSYAKARQDELVLQYAKTHGLPYVIVRPGVVFGPGKRKITDRVGISTFGPFLHLGLGNRIPLTYVDNCAEAIVLAGLKRGVDGQIFNVIDDDLPTSRQFLRQYRREVGKFFFIPVPYRLWYLFCYLWERYSVASGGQLPPVFNRLSCSIYWKGNEYPNDKAKRMLDWKVKVPMKDALAEFFAFMRSAETSGR